MISIVTKAILMALCLVACVQSQNSSVADLDYLDEPVLLWTSGIGQVGPGNGAFISPDGQLLVLVASDTSIRGINPKTGVELWVNSDAGAVAVGGAFFAEYLNTNTPYVIYAVVYDAELPAAVRYV
jgi:hypothetical protein